MTLQKRDAVIPKFSRRHAEGILALLEQFCPEAPGASDVMNQVAERIQSPVPDAGLRNSKWSKSSALSFHLLLSRKILEGLWRYFDPCTNEILLSTLTEPLHYVANICLLSYASILSASSITSVIIIIFSYNSLF